MLEEEQKKSSQLASQLEVSEEIVMNQTDTIKLLKVKNNYLASKVCGRILEL